jgi:hypothetical protein
MVLLSQQINHQPAEQNMLVNAVRGEIGISKACKSSGGPRIRYIGLKCY